VRSERNLWMVPGAIFCLWTETSSYGPKGAVNGGSKRLIFLPEGLIS
jgi:hypothetical protein